jgi:hypothetical protein
MPDREWGISNEYDYFDGKRTLRVVHIDTDKAKYYYRGHRYSFNEMGSFLRRKFENLLIISRSKQKLKIIYS